MKRLIALLVGVAAAGLLVAVAGSRHASAQDPAVVNASSIQVKFENNRVRVLEATIKPGQKEELHSHPAYVTYVIAGGKVRNHPANGEATETELKTGAAVFREPLTHWAENIGTTTIRLVLVELKNPG
ncbi:MAG TPA: cytoplasmic protein [Thermoanaerobaculia bacterium]|nr:cytoplasmic protein [Thermoanaerobaculia bacterium]